jgi:hypothetical protein
MDVRVRSDPADEASPLGWRYYLLLGALAAGLAAYLIWAASFQWFFADDFVFLLLAQQNRSWWDVLLPIRGRLWWSYRPLTIDVFFSAAYSVFGLRPFGYLVISQAVHLAVGAVVYRLCRQLGVSVPVAVAAAIFSRFRYPSMSEIMWASVFQYTGTVFFSTLSVSLFLDWLRLGKYRFHFTALAFFVLALLSNEWAVGIPMVLAVASVLFRRATLSRWGSGWRSFLDVLPFALVAAAFIVARLFIFGPPAMKGPPAYNLEFGVNVPRNLWVLAQACLDGRVQTAVFFLPLLILLARAALGNGSGTRKVWAPLKPVSLVSVAWAFGVSLPVAMLGFVHPRQAIPWEVPLSILWGGVVDVCRRSLGIGHRKVFDLMLAGSLAAAVPYGALREAVLAPRGQLAKTLIHQLGDPRMHVPAGSRVIVLYGGQGMGTRRDAERMRVEIFGGAALRVWYPQKALTFEIHEASELLDPQSSKNGPIVLFMLTSGAEIKPLDSATERVRVAR